MVSSGSFVTLTSAYKIIDLLRWETGHKGIGQLPCSLETDLLTTKEQSLSLSLSVCPSVCLSPFGSFSLSVSSLTFYLTHTIFPTLSFSVCLFLHAPFFLFSSPLYINCIQPSQLSLYNHLDVFHSRQRTVWPFQSYTSSYSTASCR